MIAPSQGGQTDEDKVKNAITPAQTALKAIEAIAVCNPYLLGSEIGIADFYLIPICVYLSKTPEFETLTTPTPKIRTWWNKVSNLPNVQKVCA